jgi:hypothetical protein
LSCEVIMEWLVFIVLAMYVGNKFNKLKSIHVDWGIIHLEFVVSERPRLI